MTDNGSVKNYPQALYQQADDLDTKADTLRMSLLAPSMKEDGLRAEAKHLREMAA